MPFGPGIEKTRALARELLNDWDTFWVVLDHPELPLTNNIAERALRHWVIARRISYGTRNPQGSRCGAVHARPAPHACQLRSRPEHAVRDGGYSLLRSSATRVSSR